MTHTHPVGDSNYVLQGAILEQWEDGKEEIHRAGDVFVDGRDVKHVKTEILGQTRSLVIIVHHVVREDNANLVPC